MWHAVWLLLVIAVIVGSVGATVLLTAPHEVPPVFRRPIEAPDKLKGRVMHVGRSFATGRTAYEGFVCASRSRCATNSI